MLYIRESLSYFARGRNDVNQGTKWALPMLLESLYKPMRASMESLYKPRDREMFL